MSNRLVSIIIPIYNAEKYLEQCLDSVVNQTYKNLEIICINDGSKDDSLEILKKYTDNDNRIVMVNQDNHGISYTRNKGIETAKGDFLVFVDSDDWIDLNTVEIALDEAENNNADIVMWPYVKEHEASSIKKVIYQEDRIIFDNFESLKKVHVSLFGPVNEALSRPENIDAISSVWGKLYRTEIVRNSFALFHDLNEIGTFEDGLFNATVFNYAKRIAYINKYFQHYRHTVSYTSGYKSKLKNQWKTLFVLMEEIIDKYHLDDTYTLALENRKAISIVQLSLSATADKSVGLQEKLNRINSILNDDYYYEAIRKLKINLMPIHWKVFFICCKYRLSFAVYVLNKCMVYLSSKKIYAGN